MRGFNLHLLILGEKKRNDKIKFEKSFQVNASISTFSTQQIIGVRSGFLYKVYFLLLMKLNESIQKRNRQGIVEKAFLSKLFSS